MCPKNAADWRDYSLFDREAVNILSQADPQRREKRAARCGGSPLAHFDGPTLRVLTLVPPDAVDRLAAALQSVATLHPARDVGQLLGDLSLLAPAALFVDPRLIPPNYVQPFNLAVRRSGVPLLVHTALTSSAMRAMLAIAPAAAREVLIRDADDDALSVRRAFERLTRDTLGGHVLARLAPALQLMPERLRDAVTALFVQPEPLDTPDRLAARAGMARRTLDRWVARSGIVSVRLLVAAPKLVLAYAQLRDGDASVGSVAARVGYASARSLEQQCEALLGMRPLVLRDEVGAEAFVERLAGGLLAEPGAGRRNAAHAAERGAAS